MTFKDQAIQNWQKFVFVGLFSAALFIQLDSALALRSLYADGSHILTQILSRENFWLLEPSRRTVQFILQAPTILSMWAGVESLDRLTVIYCLTLELIPLGLVALCYWILPSNRKILFVLPLSHYFAGTMGSSVVSIAEGPVATAYFWVLLLWILYSPNTKRRSVALASLAIPALFLHQVLAFLGPILAFAAYLRATDIPNRNAARVFYKALQCWFVAVTVAQICYIIWPRDLANRTGFLADLMSFRWLATSTAVNIPVALGLAAIITVAGILALPRARKAILLTFMVATGGVIVWTAADERLATPVLQFSARNHPAFISLPLSAVALLAYRYPGFIHRWATREIFCVLCGLAVGVLSWHYIVTKDWRIFAQTVRAHLDREHGLVPWDQFLSSLRPYKARLASRMLWAWTMPDMSILLSDKGKVQTIIANPTWGGWQPYDLTSPNPPNPVPASRFYDTTLFRSTAAAPST